MRTIETSIERPLNRGGFKTIVLAAIGFATLLFSAPALPERPPPTKNC